MPYRANTGSDLVPEPEAVTPQTGPHGMRATGGKTCTCGCDIPYINPRLPAWFKAHLDVPLLHGSSVSTREMILALQEIHAHHNVPKGFMDTILALFATAMPGPHYLPRSIHMLREVTNTPPHSKFHVHVCSAPGCSGHEYIDEPEKSKWREGESCPICQTPRFKAQVIAGTWHFVQYIAGGALCCRHERYDIGLYTPQERRFWSRGFLTSTLEWSAPSAR